jgi:GNAT superfamily N-acetyltransferase
MVEIREIIESDFTEALRCIQRAVDISNRPDYPKKIIEYQLTEHYTPEWIKNTLKDKYFIIAKVDNHIVGTGALKENEIRSMFVDPDYQHQGIGKAIIKNLEERALQQGYEGILLESSITGIEFYKKLDYVVKTNKEVEWLGEKTRNIQMIKKIKP